MEQSRLGVSPLLLLVVPHSEPPTPNNGTHWKYQENLNILKYLSMSQNLKLLEESGIQSWQNPRYPGVHHLWAVGGLNDALLPGTEMTQQETVGACCKKLTHSMRRRQSYEILRNLKFPQTHSIHFRWLFTRNQYNQHKVNLLERRKESEANLATTPTQNASGHLLFISVANLGELIDTSKLCYCYI